MSLIARLRAYAVEALGIGTVDGRAMVDDTHLAATALLVHVARVDGILAPSESERLARLVEGHYAKDSAAARDLITRATAVDTEMRDVASLVEMLPHEANGSERERLLSMAWSVAAADGKVDEFEEALVERLGRLLGFDETAIAAARRSGTTGVQAP
jgi:uncharacterized tellurite resistance protein B-like protein